VDYRGVNLYRDILSGLRDWQICASLDGTGAIGEYIRTGLEYDRWLEHFGQAVEIQRHRRQVRIDFTLTLPGMFEVTRIRQLAQTYGVDVLAKVIFSFSPDIVMSPLACLDHCWNLGSMNCAPSGWCVTRCLVQLKTRPHLKNNGQINMQRPCIGQGTCVTIRKHTHTEDHNDRNTC
jgi:hypothetical protein